MYRIVCLFKVNKQCIYLPIVLPHFLKYLFYNKDLVDDRFVLSESSLVIFQNPSGIGLILSKMQYNTLCLQYFICHVE